MRRVRGNPGNQDNNKHCAEGDIEAHNDDEAIAQKVSKKFILPNKRINERGQLLGQRLFVAD
jgi:hypothetical protein